MEEIFHWSDRETWCFTLQLAVKHLGDLADDLSRLGLPELEAVVAQIDGAAIAIKNVLSTRYDDCEC